MNFFKKIIYVIVVFLLLFLSTSIFSIVKLYFSADKISKLFLTPYYLAKIKKGETDVNIFIEYMKSKGWEYAGRTGGLMSFKKDELVLEVINRQIKTVIVQE